MPLSSINKVQRSASSEYTKNARSANVSNTSNDEDRQRSDRIEISDAARRLQESDNDTDRLENVRKRINSGFYARPDITRQAATKLSKDVENH